MLEFALQSSNGLRGAKAAFTYSHTERQPFSNEKWQYGTELSRALPSVCPYVFLRRETRPGAVCPAPANGLALRAIPIALSSF